MSFKKRIIASTSLALLLGFSTETFVDAQEIHNNENNQSQVQQTNQFNQEEVDRVANVLKVLNEHRDAIVFNEDNTSVKIKASVLQQEMSESEYNDVITDLDKEGLIANETVSYHRGVGQGMPDKRTKKQRKRQEYVDNCIGNELSKTYGIKATKSLVKIIKSKDYKKAAKEVVRKGTKAGNVVYTLSKMLVKCQVKGVKKYGSGS